MFRLEAYKNHLESQHPEDWTSYQLLSYQEKVSFFKIRDISGIHRYLDIDKNTLQFVISQSPIVDLVVGNLFFHPEEDDAFQPIAKANAMKLFKLQPDGSYLVTIKNSLRFNLAMQHVSVGLSFRQTAKVIELHRVATKNPKLNDINDHMVSQFVRVLLAVALQIISDILMDPNIWAFSLAADASTHLGVPVLDQQICVCVKGVLYNFHLVLVPFFERHTAQNYVKLIKTMLDSVCVHLGATKSFQSVQMKKTQ